MCDYTGHEFGARYPDSVCIDGYLWDADSCDEPGGGLTSGGEWACPRCNTASFLNRAVEDAKDGGCGVSMTYPWVAAVIFESACEKAIRENPTEGPALIADIKPFETNDWPDRRAVYEGRADWQETITVIYPRGEA